MRYKNIVKTILLWLPSIPVIIFFVQNAFEKIIKHDQLDKIGTSPTLLITTGLVLLIAIGLFIYHRTILYGTLILSLYMTTIVVIHIHKGKGFYLTMLIIMGTLVAGWLRKTYLPIKPD
ncbi:hypothetical protein BST92_13020 [Nonlabens arenilitoris]|uniref:DoxX family protein n=1 Tax=Nonlabens arenilitoris TaxID=1217969 RepID=A0A2S7UER7_9FLAO|nr:hypothetical protein [Nonlabens arenilitoris]PQJ32783.1 hypothetical protein BST92_13020 [Nonlabens arenilitoris]